jgi:hypothetical protein
MRNLGAKKQQLYIHILFIIVLLGTGCGSGNEFNTKVSIEGDKWYFNGQIINPGSPAEGLLMNVRMVNTVFEDRGEALSKISDGFDPDVNTNTFIEKIPEYVSHGVNAFTICLQGGMPGYEGAINTAFNADGSLREDYLQRVERLIRASDKNNAAVILSLFYQRQHSHHSALTGRESIRKAVENAINWVTEKGFTNVMIEISNEYRHGGFRNWTDGDWLISEEGQVELIKLAKSVNPNLLVTTSGMGNGTFHESLALAGDFLLIHFNNTALEDIPTRIAELKKYGKPIVCNEDDKYNQEGAVSQALTVLNGSGWGYMGMMRNQYYPFEFKGAADDPEVYQMYKNLTTPGYQVDPESLKHTAITITYPNDGEIFRVGQPVNINISHLSPDESIQHVIELHANDQKVASVNNRIPIRARWQTDDPGIYVFHVVVKDEEGKEMYKSPAVDIIVK